MCNKRELVLSMHILNLILFVGFYTMSCLPLSSGSILCDYGSCSGEVNKDVAGADTAEADNSARFKRFNDQMQVE